MGTGNEKCPFFTQKVVQTPDVFGIGDVANHVVEALRDRFTFSAISALEGLPCD